MNKHDTFKVHIIWSTLKNAEMLPRVLELRILDIVV